MKPIVKSALAAVAAGVALAGCATYDYGYGYSDTQPYYGYNYGYDGPYSYDDGPYYSGPSYYAAPSIGLGFTYRDRDRWNHDGNYSGRRNADTRHDDNYHRGDNQGSPSGPNDPWGGTNDPWARNSQQ